MTAIIEFYNGGKNVEGKTIEDYLGFSMEEMEECHNQIQWMFPLKSPSSYNPNAPLLTDEDIEEFQRNEFLKNQLRRSFYKWLWFSGLQYDGKLIHIVDYGRIIELFSNPNHNWLRVTRVLLCLNALDLQKECSLYYSILYTIHRGYNFVTVETFQYWQDAGIGIDRNDSKKTGN